MQTKLVVVLLLLATTSSSAQESLGDGTLLFQSGFEPSTQLYDQSSSWVDIRGTDRSSDISNVWGEQFGGEKLGSFRIQYGGGEPNYRLASITSDEEYPGNHFLRFWMKEVNQDRGASYGGKGRIQATIAGNRQLKNFYYRVRMRFSSDWQHLRDWDQPMGWLILSEFWNNANWTKEGHPFRIHLAMSKVEGKSKSLRFSVGAQLDENRRWKQLWHETANGFDIPLEKWISVECFLKEGNENHGQYFLAVTPDGGSRQVLFDIRNLTHHPEDSEPDGFSQFQPLKLYTHRINVDRVREKSGALQIDWDDFEIWTDREPAK